MFGKGIYFADMVTKSANYCFTTSKSNEGMLLLSEVALGDMYERTKAEMITKLPAGKHSTKGASCVHASVRTLFTGVGRTVPDPAGARTLTDGTLVPMGKSIPSKTAKNVTLEYNEYVCACALLSSTYLVGSSSTIRRKLISNI
jgi:poly [ADP-ribose] polymerase